MTMIIESQPLVLLIEIGLTLAMVLWLQGRHKTPLLKSTIIWQSLSLGAIAAILSLWINTPWTGLTATVGKASLEELFKYSLGSLILLTIKPIQLRQIIAVMVLVGLGFALLEDFFHFLDPAILATPRLFSFYLHAGTSAIMGYGLGQFRTGKGGYLGLIGSIFIAIFGHSLFNLATQIANPTHALIVTSIITILLTLAIFWLWQRAQSQKVSAKLKTS